VPKHAATTQDDVLTVTNDADRDTNDPTPSSPNNDPIPSRDLIQTILTTEIQPYLGPIIHDLVKESLSAPSSPFTALIVDTTRDYLRHLTSVDQPLFADLEDHLTATVDAYLSNLHISDDQLQAVVATYWRTSTARQAFDTRLDRIKANIIGNIQSTIETTADDYLTDLANLRADIANDIASLDREQAAAHADFIELYNNISDLGNKIMDDLVEATPPPPSADFPATINHDPSVPDRPPPTSNHRPHPLFPNASLDPQSVPDCRPPTSHRPHLHFRNASVPPPRIDAPGLSKHKFSLPSDDKADIITFYHTFANSTSQFGVRVLPLHDVRPDGSNCCPADVLPPDRLVMSHAIYTKLSDGEVLPITTSPRIRGILQQFAPTHDGYAVLYNILRLVHPLLNDTNVDYHLLPDWSETKDPFLHAGAVAHYFDLERSFGRTYSEREKTLQYLRTITDPQPIYQTTLDNLREKLMTSPTVDLAQTPNLLLVNIPHQLTLLPPPTHPDSVTNSNPTYHIHTLTNTSSQDHPSHTSSQDCFWSS
jgi:hypothetical protein